MSEITVTEVPVNGSNKIDGLPTTPGTPPTLENLGGLGQGFIPPETLASLNEDVIPQRHPSRTLVLCFDGTGDQFDSDNSNVVLLFSMLKKDDKKQQMVYYQSGIGTYTTPQAVTPLASKISKTLDGMIAWNLDNHVMSGYEFLMQNYEAGDKICIFGFSRGAYTARALAGMVHKVGLLPASNNQQIPFAYKMFTRTDELGWKQSTAFKKAFSIDVDIEFIGVWDTVSSVGLIPHRLPFTASNTSIKTFRHAVSLDERRAKFKANLFNRPTKREQKLGTQPGEMPKAGADIVTTLGQEIDTGVQAGDGTVKVAGKSATPAATPRTSMLKSNGKGSTSSGKRKQKHYEDEFSKNDGHGPHETDVLEVWFAGCHCDVGGGSVSNEIRHNLARIPLRWMIRQCFIMNTGIKFHAPLLRTVGLEPNLLWPQVIPRPAPITFASLNSDEQHTVLRHVREATAGTPAPHPTSADYSTLRTLVNYADAPADPITTGELGYGGVQLPIGPDGKPMLVMSEEEADLRDALCPIYDQLSLVPGWWILELLPMRHRVQKDDDSWMGDWTVNLGRGRKIPTRQQRRHEFNVHRSVKLRLDAGENVPGGRYTPKAQWEVEPNWVD
ncbi:hypothetical protein NLI96_g2922 [Meripilus lineatus]|uniref:T6SS Phospholipase effector Tle1-like catalytic domain-containing protein n=1 Tax=Meripilus lineatus TaxID=2056292 RepID=A0AAD5VCF9_9APHY|nr:hypothetical protein NLI96_g2922 [Physisporinus lineatus]